MSCFSPMIAVKTGHVNPETGRCEYVFLGSLEKEAVKLKEYDPTFDIDVSMRDKGQFLIPCQRGDPDARIYRRESVKYNGQMHYYKFFRRPAVILPCGQCLGCRMAYAAQWADRLMIESLDHEQSYFITLTYNDEYVPHSEVEPDVLTLKPDDFQDFVKRLRRSQEYHKDNKVRFYAVGEYGSIGHRPHYHMIAFGLQLDDLYEIGKNKLGRVLHSSKVIEKLWPFGRVEVDIMTWETAAYCARYTVKKLGKKETGFYEEHGLVPEFSRMSLKPGIGQKYFDENFREIYEEDKIHLSTGSGARTVKPPRFYDRKYDDIYPDGMERIKANRQSIAKEHLRFKMQNFSGSYFELLANEEQNFKNRTKTLRRELEL